MILLQTNEDSGKQRPIMRSLVEYSKEETEGTNSTQSNELFPSPQEKSPSSNSAESMEVEGDSDFFHRRSAIQSIRGVTPEDAATIVSLVYSYLLNYLILMCLKIILRILCTS